MTRANAVVIALATELAATRAAAARLPFEIGTKMQLTVNRLLERLGLSRASQEKTTESRTNHPTL
jgi:hypothetical protein